MMTLIPTGAHEDAEVGRQRLLDIEAEALLQGALTAIEGDVRKLVVAIQKSRYGLAVVAHVGVIEISQGPNMGIETLEPLRLPFQLQVFRARTAQIGVKIRAVGHGRHQRLPEAGFEFGAGITEN